MSELINIHAICGTPRSGSTLLCNLLNQNPDFYASSTSCVPQLVAGISDFWSTSTEVKSDLIRDEARTQQRLLRSARSTVSSWYEDIDAPFVFDKGRFWASQPDIFRQLFPQAHMFVCVRDLRGVFASIEKQHQKNPIIHNTPNTLKGRVHDSMSPIGVIGQQVKYIEDLCVRQLPFVHFVKYEDFTVDPSKLMDAIGDVVGSEFVYDFENVVNVAEDIDGLYLNKFPHEGSGKVTESSPNWVDTLPANVTQEILSKFPMYNDAFQYGE